MFSYRVEGKLLFKLMVRQTKCRVLVLNVIVLFFVAISNVVRQLTALTLFISHEKDKLKTFLFPCMVMFLSK